MGKYRLENALAILPNRVLVILCAHLMRIYLPMEKTDLLNELYQLLNLKIKIKE